MADEDEEKKDEEKADDTASPETGKFKLRRAGEVVVTYHREAVKPPEGKRIHPRRFLPLVPDALPQEPSKEKDQEKE